MPQQQSFTTFRQHDDVIKWKHFPRYCPFVRGIHRSPVNSPHKGQWRGALIFSLICVWINGWVNNREGGNLRRYRAHYDVTVMRPLAQGTWWMFVKWLIPTLSEILLHCRSNGDIHSPTPKLDISNVGAYLCLGCSYVKKIQSHLSPDENTVDTEPQYHSMCLGRSFKDLYEHRLSSPRQHNTSDTITTRITMCDSFICFDICRITRWVKSRITPWYLSKIPNTTERLLVTDMIIITVVFHGEPW